ncbi:MAG: right-handed parallel beta-helix repeat-containing protein [Planctomycetales bacterium]|nr:right-handed parallel beta-helix repeat-containing protein [Planctomycetales bacterium]
MRVCRDRRFHTCCILVLLAGASPATSGAREIFVNNVAGDDRYEGSAPQASNVGGGPLRTIAHALRLAKPGDRIILANTPEPYRESITLEGFRHSGSAEKPLAIIGNGAVVDGSAPVPDEVWEHYQGNVFRFAPRRSSHVQLFHENRPLTRVPIPDGSLRVPKLEPLQWCLFGREVYFRVDAKQDDQQRNKLPQNYHLTHTGLPVGVTLYDVRNVMIADLIVQGFQLDGVNAHDKAFNVQLVGVVCRGNGRSGVTVAGSSQVEIVEATIGDNGPSQILCEGYSHTAISNSHVFANTGPSVQRETSAEVLIEGLTLGGLLLDEDISPAPPAAP